MMIVRIILACVVALSAATLSVLAQAPPPNAPPQKDRKDFVIDALEQQRNNVTSGLAMCEATFNDVAAQLRKQIADLTAENAKLKKPADTPPAAAADPTPK